MNGKAWERNSNKLLHLVLINLLKSSSVSVENYNSKNTQQQDAGLAKQTKLEV